MRSYIVQHRVWVFELGNHIEPKTGTDDNIVKRYDVWHDM